MKQINKNVMFNNGNMKKMRITPYLDINKCLLNWFNQYLDKNIPISEIVLLKKQMNMTNNWKTIILIKKWLTYTLKEKHN